MWIPPAEFGPLEICMRFLTQLNGQQISPAGAG
ncbi:hypothetical protein RS9916_28409 [Synechococcus sp. RS9916]|nr:hypothetical protein RS9916_28409 [Synechococcus sp. RS9916]